MLALLGFVLFFVAPSWACSLDADCGSADNSQPGLCVGGVCQCGIGFSGNQLVDPTACSLTCSPAPVPDSVAFLREPNVTVTASGGNVVLDVSMAPYLKQTPASVAFLNPLNGSACPLMPSQLGSGQWTQEIVNDASQCFSHYVFAAPFAASVGEACWETLAPSVETGAQYSITFNQYKTQVEVIQEGLAPFGQSASRAVKDDVTIKRAFRRDYTISVATQFKPNSAPFSLIAAPPVGPTAVDDSATTPQNVPKTIAVLGNDIAGYQTLDGVDVPNALDASTLTIVTQPEHGSLSISEGAIVYTPSDLYHGPDAFSYQICDAASLCDSANVAIQVLPDPPVANDDAAQCAFESSVDIDILANDVAGVGGFMTVMILDQPTSGSVSIFDNNTVRYTAGSGFSGLDNFTYQVCDGSNPTMLCDSAVVTVDVDGTGPVAVNDALSVPQNSGASNVNVLANDLQGTEALNPGSVTILEGPSNGVASVVADGSINYTPAAGYHGPDTVRYEVCDVASPPKCASAVVAISVVPSGPQAVDDSISTPYSQQVTVPVLSNDVAGAQPLQPSSVSIVSAPSSGSATVNPDGSISYTPNAGFVGSDSLTYQVCDNSTPTPLCDTATVTIVVQPLSGAGIQYRLVTIDYDLLGNAIAATVQTRTPSSAKVASVQLSADSSGLAPVVSGPTTGTACDAASPAGSCDQFHEIRFSNTPCSVSAAEMVLTAEFKCADGSDPSTCGYQSVQSSFRLDNLILTYDACPRVVQYGVDSAVSFLRLHEDVPRAVPVSAPAQQGSTLYGRCSVEPSAGATFQSVTLSALNVIQQSAGGPIDLGDKLGESYLLMLSALSQNSPTNPVWDFNLEMDPSIFLLANTYYLEATLDLTFANTGPLTRKLRMPLLARASGAKLRSTLSNPHAVALVALSERADNDSETQEGIFSNTFEMRAADAEAEATDGASSSAESGSNTAMIAGIAGGVAGLVVVSAFIVAAVVFKKRRDSRERSASDAPLRSVGVSNDLDL